MIPIEEVRAMLTGQQPSPLAMFLWQNMREGWAFIRADGTMELVNPAFAEMLGWSASELQGRRFQEITSHSDIVPDESELRRVISGETRSYTMVKSYRTKMGGTVTAKLRVHNFERGALVCGTILPIDTLSLDHLPEEDAKRVLAMLVGRWAVERWKLILTILAAVAGILRLDDILAALQ